MVRPARRRVARPCRVTARSVIWRGVLGLRRLLAVPLLLAAAGAASGDTPLPAGVPDLIAARGLALGAYNGVITGNDGIFVNAASLAARRRYSIEGSWLLDRYGGENALQVWGISIVDSETTGVTGGLAYTRVFSGPWIGNLFHAPLAVALSQNLFVGITGKYFSMGGPAGDSMRSANMDASAFYRSATGFGLGVAGYNLFDAGHVGQFPRALGVGMSYGDERKYHFAADWRGDFQRQGRTTHLFAFGGELLLGDTVPVRASYLDDETRNASFWSVGAGLVSASGIAIDAAYRQGFQDASDRTFAVTLKIFVSAR
jgi:hypothetical protein